MRELPDYIWYLVATYVSPNDLQGLLTVNRPFLNVVLDGRYGEIEWANPKRMVRSLIRLNDPYIASRTKTLFVRRSVMENLLWNKSDFEDTMPSIVVGKIYDLLATIHGPSPISPVSEISLDGLADRPRDIVRLMADVITKMVNLQIFILEWSDFTLNKDTQRLLESIRSSFTPNLFRLALHIRIADFTHMFSGTRLDGLHELELQFDYDYSATSDTLNDVAPYLTKIFPFLTSLKISSTVRLDHSQFFSAIDRFPHLRLLSTRLPFNNIHLSDPSGLNRMLVNHSDTLLHLEVLPEFWDELDGASVSTWPVFLEQCLLDLAQWPASLQSLTIPSTHLPTTMSLIRRVADTLTTLRLVHHYLTYLEVVDVIDLFSHRSYELKHLTLDITLITPNLINLLASKLPGLFSLTLVIQDATNTMHALLRIDPRGSDQIEWNLWDLAIFNRKYRDDSNFIASPVSFEFEEGLMYQMTFLLPSLRSFKGRGHTNAIRIS